MEERGICCVKANLYLTSIWLDKGYLDLFRKTARLYKQIVIFDLDGTLADISHRLHYIIRQSGNKKDWDSFFEECVNDTPIINIVNLLKSLKRKNVEIWILSGRSSVVMRQTIKWLDKVGIGYDYLFMRCKDDHRLDTIIKEEWYQELPQIYKQNIMCVFEDRQSVVDMWRGLGVTCCQVSDGDY